MCHEAGVGVYRKAGVGACHEAGVGVYHKAGVGACHEGCGSPRWCRAVSPPVS